MKRKKYFNYLILLPLIAAVGLFNTACSSDDDFASSNSCYEGEIRGSDGFGNTYIITTSVPPDSPYKEIGTGVFVSVKTSFIMAHGLNRGDIIEFQILSYSIDKELHDGLRLHARYICDIKLCE